MAWSWLPYSWRSLELNQAKKTTTLRVNGISLITFIWWELATEKVEPVNLKCSHNLEVESYVLFGGNFYDFRSKWQHLKYPERNVLRRQRGVKLYRHLQKGASSLNIKRWLLVKENKISQGKEFSNFLCMGRGKSLGSRKSLLSCVSEIWLCTSSVPCPPWGAAAAQRMPESKHCPSWAQKFTPGRLVSLMAVASLFIDTAGDTPFHKPMLFIYSFIHSFIQSFTLYILSHCFGNLLKQRAWWCCKPQNWAHLLVGIKIKDTAKSKIRRRKDLFLAASKENTGELSQAVSPWIEKLGYMGYILS